MVIQPSYRSRYPGIFSVLSGKRHRAKMRCAYSLCLADAFAGWPPRLIPGRSTLSDASQFVLFRFAGEFSCKSLISSVNAKPNWSELAESKKFPVFFPVSGEILPARLVHRRLLPPAAGHMFPADLENLRRRCDRHRCSFQVSAGTPPSSGLPACWRCAVFRGHPQALRSAGVQ